MKKMFGSNFKTYKPLKGHKRNPDQKLLSQYAKATLGSGNMKNAVQLPPGEDLNEWLAVNTVEFFNEISLLYGTVAEFCDSALDSCKLMKAGDAHYLWADGVTIKKPISVSAPEYVDLLMNWVENQLNDEQIFPLQATTAFPKNFLAVIKTIFKRLFRVYAHIYHAHFPKVVGLGAEAHLNTCFKHFIFFVDEYKLIETRELKPMEEVIKEMMNRSSSAPPAAEGGSGEKEKAAEPAAAAPSTEQKKE
mmetsp:Transcript_14860/g.20964  ORF Transcript_14860/g.20964 Transcript_14860/m.20964 type:complete len:248 (-) Transcript_14860:109-852(-)